MEFLIKLGVFLVLVAIGYWRGRRNERAHLQSLDAEEDALTDILIFATRYPPASAEVLDPVLVSGSAVIGSDYFRLFVAGLRKIVGGNYRAYEQLMERGRRQALVRLKQAAKAQGAKMVFNVRLTTSRISNSRGGEATQVEVLAYGTAFVRAQGTVTESRVGYVPGAGAPLENKVPALRHRKFTLYWMLVCLAMGVYLIVSPFLDRGAHEQWRYTAGAPWLVFAVVAVLITAVICRHAIRAKSMLSDWIVMAILTFLILLPVQYFVLLKLNAALDPNPRDWVYIVQAGGKLHGRDRGAPKLELEYYARDGKQEFWSQIPAGTPVDIRIAHGLPGVYQYDLLPLSADYTRFYEQGKAYKEPSTR